MKILSIEAIKEGSLITRVFPTNGYSGDSSYIGEKLELIKLTKTKIILKSFEDKSYREISLPLRDWKYGWRQYELCGDNKYAISPWSERRGQLRVQYVYLGFELDRLRMDDPHDKFGDYLMACRYLEKIGCNC